MDRSGNIITFDPDKCYLLCVSLKKDFDLHRPLYMDALSTAEVDVLKILGIHFDQKLTCSRQCLGTIYRVKDYFGECGPTIGFKSFVNCEASL